MRKTILYFLLILTSACSPSILDLGTKTKEELCDKLHSSRENNDIEAMVRLYNPGFADALKDKGDHTVESWAEYKLNAFQGTLIQYEIDSFAPFPGDVNRGNYMSKPSHMVISEYKISKDITVYSTQAISKIDGRWYLMGLVPD